MTQVKGDPNSPLKNVPAPQLPEPQVGDPDYIGFDKEVPHQFFYIGKKRWKIRRLGLNKTEELKNKTKEYDSIVLHITDISTVAIVLLEKREQNNISKEEEQELEKLQIDLTKSKIKRDDMRNSLIRELIPLILIEEDGTPFSLKHFDDNEISPMKWFLVLGNLINFLEVSL